MEKVKYEILYDTFKTFTVIDTHSFLSQHHQTHTGRRRKELHTNECNYQLIKFSHSCCVEGLALSKECFI